MTAADVIVVGGGHNGLICGAYLARAGIDTLLLEARQDVGGCASTVDDLGARFNICSCDHSLIRGMPIIDELELQHHGLRYLEPDAGGIQLFHDGADPWVFFHDPDRTLDALARSYPSQVDGYRRYLRDATPAARMALEMARTAPGTGRMTRRALARRGAGAARLVAWSRRSVADVFADYFDDWHLAMPAITVGPTVWGTSPTAPGTGLAALSYATRHLVPTGRPVGGSGALTDAIRHAFEAAGGQVRCGARVERLAVRDGRTEGVVLTDGTRLDAHSVVAACDPQRVFVDWIDEVPPRARRGVEHWRRRPVVEGYQSKIDAVLTRLPRYRASDLLAERLPDLDPLVPTVSISPSPDELADAHARRAHDEASTVPSMLANFPSVLDPTMVTSTGKHVLSLEVLFTPYGAAPEPERWLSQWSRFLQNDIADSIAEFRVMTPDRYEREFSMHRGHTPAFAGAPLTALLGTQRALTRYRAPIAGLYLSGAATFPGAGVFGAPGRNTASTVLTDLHGAVGRPLDRIRRRAATIGAS